ncbi:MAG TPA: tyrosine-type recombinase/integrase [Urbifossiella sp.]|nr:tyrosine-type recombinase/integrase [Urbifossiella sp.]
MARTPAPVPTYKKHPTNRTARTWVGGRYVTLGPWNSPESKAAFRRICAAVEASSPTTVAAQAAAHVAGNPVTVNELILAFWEHVEDYYRRPDGTPTKEVDEYRQALRVVRRLFEHEPAAEFGPVALQTVRAEMVKAKAAGGLGWCRSRINKQVGRIKRCWRWGVAQELIRGGLVDDLDAVAGLRRKRSAARETAPVKPAPQADYLAALPHLVPTVRAMVELQRTGGLRPGEVRLLIPDDLDRSGDLWVYRPEEHKMSHLGRDKAVPLPPAARAIIEPWLSDRGPTDPLFSPERAREEMYAAWRLKRKSKPTPSELRRRKRKEEMLKRSRELFTDHGYAAWVRRACRRAKVKPWTPGQLRHSFGTEVRERFGLEVAQVLMGHKNAKVTEIYAEAALRSATEAAKAMG